MSVTSTVGQIVIPNNNIKTMPAGTGAIEHFLDDKLIAGLKCRMKD